MSFCPKCDVVSPADVSVFIAGGKRNQIGAGYNALDAIYGHKKKQRKEIKHSDRKRGFFWEVRGYPYMTILFQ